MTPQHKLTLGMIFCWSALALFLCSCGRDVAPEIGTVTPASGHGRTQTFRLQVSYPGGAGDINDVAFFFGDSLADSAHACWIDITGGVSSVAIRANDDKGYQPGVAVGTAGVAANDKCSVPANQIKVEREGNQLVVSLPVTFTDALKGDVKVWAIASGPNKHSGWQERGAWTVE